MDFPSIEEFRKIERAQAESNLQMRSVFISMLGIPTVLAAAAEGAAYGAAIGAPFAGIGAIPGFVIGGIIGGFLALVSMSLLTTALIPWISNCLVAIYWRILHGSFDFRYLNAYAKAFVKERMEKFFIIAVQIKKLRAYGLLNSNTVLIEGLSPLEKGLYQSIYQQVLSYENEEDMKTAIAQNMKIALYEKDFIKMHLHQLRCHKKWLRAKLKTDPSHRLVRLDPGGGMSPGRSPMAIFTLLLKLFTRSRWVVRKKRMSDLGADGEGIRTYYRLGLLPNTGLVAAISVMDKTELSRFARKTFSDAANFLSQTPTQLSEYKKVLTLKIEKLEAKTEKTGSEKADLALKKADLLFANQALETVSAWYEKKREKWGPIAKMDMTNLSFFHQHLEAKLPLVRNDDSTYQRTSLRLWRLQKFIQEKKENQRRENTLNLNRSG